MADEGCRAAGCGNRAPVGAAACAVHAGRPPVYGEAPCGFGGCGNRAYWCLPGDAPGRLAGYYCGVHLRADLPRRPLPKDAGRLRAGRADSGARRLAAVLEAAAANRAAGVRGRVAVAKKAMLKAPPPLEGFLDVYPNRRAAASLAGGTWGLAAPELSPMALGPVFLPDGGRARCIENAHQFRKFYPDELGPDGGPTPAAREHSRALLEGPPLRHKPAAGDAKKKRPTAPAFHLHTTAEGEEHRLGYVQSRQFYCAWYEVLASAEPKFALLRALLREGVSLRLVGFDGHDFADEAAAYADAAQPFGHEAVLACLLRAPDSGGPPHPWRTARTPGLWPAEGPAASRRPSLGPRSRAARRSSWRSGHRPGAFFRLGARPGSRRPRRRTPPR